MSSSCSICIEPYNKSKRAPVVCDYCEYSACRECSERFMLNMISNAHCMNCKREWNRTILINKFTKKFVDNDYKKHQEKILFEREKALLPATQPVVENHIKKLKIQKEIRELKELVKKTCREIYEKETRLLRNDLDDNKKEKNIFIKKCPNGDCRGFLNKEWQCGLCQLWSCSNCHEIRGSTNDCDHDCKMEDIETAKLLSKDSKSCPSCGTMIFKESGCSQMFCIQCHTAFDWTSGRIENGVIHNPHYFEWLRRNGNQERNPLDIQCGREINRQFIEQFVRISNSKVLLNVCQSIAHIRSVELPRYVRNNNGNNEDLRVKYLMKEMDENKFKTLLQQRRKESNKKHEFSNILNMYTNSATDILYRYMYEIHSLPKSINLDKINKQYVIEFISLQMYTSECLMNISKVYSCTKYIINNNGYFIKLQ